MTLSGKKAEAAPPATDDELTDIFYGCTICQSIAFEHVCIITPERPGLCGRCSWINAKNYYRAIPTGGHQPIKKGSVIDFKAGVWSGVNKFVRAKSHKKIGKVSLYSIIKYPMTSSVLAECVVAIMPEVNGVIIVDRKYKGCAPIGITAKELFDMIKPGRQIPGFMGISRSYILSKKFISAEGGLARVVWMSKKLKERLRGELNKRAIQIGCKGLIDRIADETIACDPDELKKYLILKRHPILSSPPIIGA